MRAAKASPGLKRAAAANVNRQPEQNERGIGEQHSQYTDNQHRPEYSSRTDINKSMRKLAGKPATASQRDTSQRDVAGVPIDGSNRVLQHARNPFITVSPALLEHRHPLLTVMPPDEMPSELLSHKSR